MKYDEIEKFVRDNEGQFDQIEQPDLNRLWADFNKNKKSLVVKRRIWMLAASIAILLALTAGLIGYSLGGLVIRSFLSRYKNTEIISKISKRKNQDTKI